MFADVCRRLFAEDSFNHEVRKAVIDRQSIRSVRNGDEEVDRGGAGETTGGKGFVTGGSRKRRRSSGRKYTAALKASEREVQASRLKLELHKLERENTGNVIAALKRGTPTSVRD